ncbi:hypothetical protein HELRODRAFT_179441 [Helobdella robusta]|uniref:Uncharacterized protein n=1 Tax=Helobdella robusta TaxID=6412 RepID=T1FEQ0_HELRO|nr:hypothetical protein HELRODRAFT_179441 [Helobdella robusta]ESN95370.1 hypothetical protein HELRODRAFT_179441 [Helobdella robusta]
MLEKRFDVSAFLLFVGVKNIKEEYHVEGRANKTKTSQITINNISNADGHVKQGDRTTTSTSTNINNNNRNTINIKYNNNINIKYNNNNSINFCTININNTTTCTQMASDVRISNNDSSIEQQSICCVISIVTNDPSTTRTPATCRPNTTQN